MIITGLNIWKFNGKYTDYSEPCYNERIMGKGKYEKLTSHIMINNQIEVGISEINQYLPVNHPDLTPDLTQMMIL